MVQSVLDKTINYNENRSLAKDDSGYEATMFEYELNNNNIIIIALGQAKYEFIDKDTTNINGGIRVKSLPTLDIQEGTINYDDIDNFDII